MLEASAEGLHPPKATDDAASAFDALLEEAALGRESRQRSDPEGALFTAPASRGWRRRVPWVACAGLLVAGTLTAIWFSAARPSASLADAAASPVAVVQEVAERHGPIATSRTSGEGSAVILAAAKRLRQGVEQKVWLATHKQFEVVRDGFVNVSKNKSITSKVLGTRMKGAILLGVQDGEWVKLAGELAYVPTSSLQERQVTFQRISNGTCNDIGMYSIMEHSTCESAAAFLGASKTRVASFRSAEPRPEGCYMFDGKSVWLATHPMNRGNGAAGKRMPICMKHAGPCTAPVEAKKGGSPSLFCWSVVTLPGYEIGLLRKQYETNASIFGCDGWDVFSNRRGVRLGLGRGSCHHPVEASEIPHGPWAFIGTQPGTSWPLIINTMPFLRVWHKIYLEGRFRRHDWTIKIDPDSVFLSERLRHHLRPHTEPHHGTPAKAFKNCPSFNSMQGPIEVLSAKAVEKLGRAGWRCKQKVSEFSTGEDIYMNMCLGILWVPFMSDWDLMADWKCREAPGDCKNKRKVVFHPLKNVTSYLKCLKNAEE